jgi:hypothetical protein
MMPRTVRRRTTRGRPCSQRRATPRRPPIRSGVDRADPRALNSRARAREHRDLLNLVGSVAQRSPPSPRLPSSPPSSWSSRTERLPGLAATTPRSQALRPHAPCQRRRRPHTSTALAVPQAARAPTTPRSRQSARNAGPVRHQEAIGSVGAIGHHDAKPRDRPSHDRAGHRRRRPCHRPSRPRQHVTSSLPADGAECGRLPRPVAARRGAVGRRHRRLDPNSCRSATIVADDDASDVCARYGGREVGAPRAPRRLPALRDMFDRCFDATRRAWPPPLTRAGAVAILELVDRPHDLVTTRRAQVPLQRTGTRPTHASPR